MRLIIPFKQNQFDLLVSLRQDGDIGTFFDDSMTGMIVEYHYDKSSGVMLVLKMTRTEYSLLPSPYPTDCVDRKQSRTHCLDLCHYEYFANHETKISHTFVNMSSVDGELAEYSRVSHGESLDKYVKQCRKLCEKPTCHRVNFIITNLIGEPTTHLEKDERGIHLHLNNIEAISTTLPKLTMEDLVIGSLTVYGSVSASAT